MGNLFILIFMLFMHVIADYNVQGCLADMKQKQWWINSCNNLNISFDKYKNDYKMALVMHSFSWAFLIMLPLFIADSFSLSFVTVFLLIANTIAHYCIDDWKANDHEINLVQDQTFHIIQIVVSFGLWYLWGLAFC